VDVCEAREGTVGGEVVGGDDDTVLEFDGDDGGAGYDGRLSVGCWVLLAGVGGGEVRVVVGAVDVVAGLEKLLVWVRL